VLWRRVHTGAAATQLWLRAFHGEAHPWVDAPVVVTHPPSARTSPIATRMIPVCRAFGAPNVNWAREPPGCSHYRGDC
jgi:hypothetical protein